MAQGVLISLSLEQTYHRASGFNLKQSRLSGEG
jgi:hypothetical protein